MLIQARHDWAGARREFQQALRSEPRLFNAREGLAACDRLERIAAASQRAAASAPASTPAAGPP
jgi:hypothetical protein